MGMEMQADDNNLRHNPNEHPRDMTALCVADRILNVLSLIRDHGAPSIRLNAPLRTHDQTALMIRTPRVKSIHSSA